ncbi:hypothetical protein [Phenylobacterium sp.]|uniref:hypothetical protein n=1 Tax=Phenylobacterium sp. TaxID=1871053 RepID=UPI00273480B2|nr:hypothetical protein [Phenylobacterium sp.]MDP3853180.1 hypothetical protein [Phenylobacterium sp.]
MDYLTRKQALAVMERALQGVFGHRRAIGQQMRDAALAHAQARHPEFRRSSHFPCSSRWSKADAHAMDQHLVALHFARGRELAALDAKIERQRAAINAFRSKHGINAPFEIAA